MKNPNENILIPPRTSAGTEHSDGAASSSQAGVAPSEAHVVFGAWLAHHEAVANPDRFEMPWPEFVERVTSALHIREDKFAKDGSAPGFSLARFVERDGEVRRANRYVDVLSAVTLDFDERYDPEGVFERLDCGIAWLAYTTFQHAPGKPRWRVIVPTATPIPHPQYKAVRAWLLASIINKGSGIKHSADEAAKAVSNFYYLPGCPAAAAEHAEFRVASGIVLALPPMSEFSRGMPAPQAIGSNIDAAFLRARMGSYSKAPELRLAFRLALKGKPFAERGARNGTLFRMCGALAGWARQADPMALALLLGPSIEATATRDEDDPPPTLEDAADMIARGQSGLLAKATEESTWVVADATVIDRPVPIPADAFEQDARDAGLESGDELRSRLILRTGGSSNWVWRTENKTWAGPMFDAPAQVSARKDLVLVPGVDLWVRKADGGARLKVMPELMHEYGEIVTKVSYSLRTERARYRPIERHLELAAATRRALKPCELPFLSEWLVLFGGTKADNLLDWIATITAHDKMAHILFLRGGPGTGKSLLVRGLSRIWNVDGATDYVRVSSSFNYDLLSCPLVALEEGSWESGNKDAPAFLRKLSGAAQHSINRKYHDPVELSGFLRIIIAMNNASIFSSKGPAFTPDDRDAVAERFLEIEPNPRARALLETLDHTERDALVTEDKLAAHALWLAQERGALARGRYASLSPDDRGMSVRIASANVWGSFVMEWLARYLSNPSAIEQSSSGLLSRDGHRVVISPEAIVNTFSTTLKNKQAPLSNEISNALASLAIGKQVNLPSGKGTGFEIHGEDVAKWSEEKGIGNPNAIRINSVAPMLRSVKGGAT